MELRRNLPFSMDKPYFEVYKTDEFINSVQGPVNRFRDFSSFESGLQKGLIRTQTFKNRRLSTIIKRYWSCSKDKRRCRGTRQNIKADERYYIFG
jgi:hypothetical protein